MPPKSSMIGSGIRLAKNKLDVRNALIESAHTAYERGDGASAHEHSEQGRRHAQMMDQYNRQASEFIFRENNAEGRVASDTIDLHGQFVEEAEAILDQRIRAGQSQGQTHLHVIVGKGNHSVNHVQKLKPAVERLCRERGLQFHTEENAGRIYINLTGGPANMPPSQHHGQQPYGGQPSHHHQQQQQQHHHQQQQHHQQNQNEEIERIVKRFLPRVLKKLEAHCCVVM
ncbi:MAG: hypothetical protein M1816_001805 [Peltula sp. TS41687]|nr:MAG: hypothetical protein M1816_001805 [Peltula sp. TS41687]